MDANLSSWVGVFLVCSRGEVSFLAHLQQGSVEVTEGAMVQASDLIGACGNSSEPHLHYHLQTDRVLYGGTGGEGLPAQFLDYLADGERVERGEPVQGQIVAHGVP